MINGKPIGGMLERMENHPQVKLGDEIREALKNILLKNCLEKILIKFYL